MFLQICMPIHRKQRRELRAEREARSLLHFLRDQGHSQSEWLAALSAEREPSGFWPDESISAPFDLPRPGTLHPIAVRRAIKPRLPDPFFPEVEGSE